jgi:hypothetical protein
LSVSAGAVELKENRRLNQLMLPSA